MIWRLETGNCRATPKGLALARSIENAKRSRAPLLAMRHPQLAPAPNEAVEPRFQIKIRTPRSAIRNRPWLAPRPQPLVPRRSLLSLATGQIEDQIGAGMVIVGRAVAIVNG